MQMLSNDFRTRMFGARNQKDKDITEIERVCTDSGSVNQNKCGRVAISLQTVEECPHANRIKENQEEKSEENQHDVGSELLRYL